MDRPYQFYYFVPLVTVWFVIIYATMAMWPQILQKRTNMWPISKLFELDGSIHEWWFRWKLDRFAVIHGMMFAFIYLVLQKRQVLSEGKGEALFPAKISNLLLFLSVVSFIVRPFTISLLRSYYYLYLQKCLILVKLNFLQKYHIWLAADTKGILVLIPGSPTLNILVSTFIFVCVAHEVSLITNDLAQVVIPKDSMALLRRLGAVAVFSLILLLLSSGNRLTPGT
ncbi:hypothetical protein GOODEAATRI_004360 [Goodea atripinnis]|uniref:Cas1p 10 TM acyl transferase domain-containing protein n=1 Tax=Goodea atripinnis TaxID=208336 RepID=A0ABV0N7S8_9TELE